MGIGTKQIALVRLGEFRAASNVEDSEYVDTYNWKRLLGCVSRRNTVRTSRSPR